LYPIAASGSPPIPQPTGRPPTPSPPRASAKEVLRCIWSRWAGCAASDAVRVAANRASDWGCSAAVRNRDLLTSSVLSSRSVWTPWSASRRPFRKCQASRRHVWKTEPPLHQRCVVLPPGVDEREGWLKFKVTPATVTGSPNQLLLHACGCNEGPRSIPITKLGELWLNYRPEVKAASVVEFHPARTVRRDRVFEYWLGQWR